VGDALVDHGKTASVVRLVRNPKAEFDRATLEKLVKRATEDAEIASDLRGRSDIDWKSLRGEIDQVAGKVLQTLGNLDRQVDPIAAGKINTVVYNRIRNRAGFNAQEWKVAYNQVKGLADRKQLDDRALARFARFGYGHHAAAAMAVMLQVAPEIVVKWLAGQDYVAVIVALRATGMAPDLFEAIVATLPWRDLPSDADKKMILSRFDALDRDDAKHIFELWRAHSFRKRAMGEDRQTA